MKQGRPRGKAKPLTVEMVSALSTVLGKSGDPTDKRNFAMVRVGIDTMLRASDIAELRVGDVLDKSGDIVTIVHMKQKKTNKAVTCQLSDQTREAIKRYLPPHMYDRRGAKLFDVTTRHMNRIIKAAISMLNMDDTGFSCHSLRRTKPSMLYAKTQNIEAIRQLLGHSSVSATSEYLNVSMNDALKLASELNI